MWEWLETTPVAIWVSESAWAYPLCLSLHAIGLAVVVGIFMMRDLRLLGLFRELPLQAFLTIGKLAWCGFIVNAVSGTLLFTAQASTFVHSTIFLWKLGFIAVGMIMAGVIQARLREDTRTAGMVPASATQAPLQAYTFRASALQLMALASLSLWTGAVITGRLIAYF